MENSQARTIEVTVDKSHIVTIGERLYGESIELIRELVNNAYDADAAEVKVTLQEDVIAVEDDGVGMDISGLKQYFNIGSSFKKNNPKSPRFGRERIGEFGIGKFASLSACSHFEVWTKKGDFQAKVIFDKSEWAKSKDKWHIPLEVEEVDHRLKDGTKVILKGLTKRFDFADVERRLIEAVPIKAPDFAVYLNNHKISARFIPGHKIPFLEGTEYGVIYGEIVISSSLEQDISEAGIECKVKQVTVARDFFDLDKIKHALLLNPDFCPEGLIPIGEGISASGQPGYIPSSRAELEKKEEKAEAEVKPTKKRKKAPSVKRLTNTAVIKKLKIGQQGVSCAIDHFTPEGPECFTEGTIIYINRDHPLYQKEAQRRDTYELHIARLITQEICLMKDQRNPRQAFERQSKLLKDTLISRSA